MNVDFPLLSTCTYSCDCPEARQAGGELRGVWRFPNAYYKGLEKLVYEVPNFYPWMVHEGIGNVNESFAMTWRFSVMGDPLVNRYIVRDSDSPLIQREVDAVNEWINLGTCFHTMRDHIAHLFPVMGGMWGGCNYWQPDKNKGIRTTLFLSRKVYGGDQNALTTYLLPWAKENMTSHTSYPCKQFPGSLPFPTRRVSGTFVGSRNYRMRNDTIFRKCPWECRPKLHKDWERC
ncbi:hypothetical protein Pcinc_043281 [Petrolisthes cinctipes]|uniref:Uncharacterized protein n=1 Tax=Petrolisthes cinctipes TaxID=88211 RepID=A0AAE1EF79_PETCI|nr:hypothetical protein Pcinc_043281 [Petrolisthes cinctipes]